MGPEHGILDRAYVEKVYAGWLGKIMGVRHGAPVEGWSAADIERVFGELDGFVLPVDVFEPDDDINGPLFFLRALEDERAGEDITPAQMARAWTNYPPYEHGFFWWPGYGKPTAYHRLERGESALNRAGKPDTGLGPRIFADTWGLVAPGNLPLAAKLARAAVRVSAAPGGAGEDAAVLQVCMIAAAFIARGAEEALEAALRMIPPEGDVARMARDVLAESRAHPGDWKATRAAIAERWAAPRFPGMFHAVSNTAYILLGLLHSEGNLRRGLSICTQCGLDTDCNSGNLGAILGVLLGLEGIDPEMRRTVNDVVICSSVLGEQNIGDIPSQAKGIALAGFRLARQAPPDWLAEGARAQLWLDFLLPGSTHGLRASSHADAALRAASADGMGCARVWCNAVDARTGARVYHRTYYRPEDVHNNRYDPCFSPKVYPGQIVTAEVRAEGTDAPLVAAPFVYDGNAKAELEGEFVSLAGGAWTTLRWRIPPASGACVEQVGVRFLLSEAREGGFTALIRHLTVEGAPEYAMDFAKERMECWSFVQHECSQFTYSRGQWYYEDGALHGEVASFGEAFTGARCWRDYAVRCTLRPGSAHGARLLFRAQGARRYYAIALVEGGVALLRENHGETVLAAVKLDWRPDEPVTLCAQARGNRLLAYVNGAPPLEAEDDAFDSGCVGFGLRGDCAAASFLELAVDPPREEEE